MSALDSVIQDDLKDDLGAFGLKASNDECLSLLVANSSFPEKKAGRIICSYSSRLNISVSQTQDSQYCRIEPAARKEYTWDLEEIRSSSSSASVDRFMYQRPLAKSEVLDTWCWKQVKRILAAITSGSAARSASQGVETEGTSVASQECSDTNTNGPLPPKTNKQMLRPANARLQTPSFVAGRVAACPTSNMDETQPSSVRLHPSNACLIGARRAGGGEFSSAMLELSSSANLASFSLYPGQPVVLRATNPTGRSLTVFDVFPTPFLPLASYDKTAFEHDLHVSIACGPFTTNSSHEPTPLLALLQDIKANRPNVLILIGPLVDSAHPNLAVRSFTCARILLFFLESCARLFTLSTSCAAY
ncbi:unnamed protein product, partial [Dibothriocephalus latus]